MLDTYFPLPILYLFLFLLRSSCSCLETRKYFYMYGICMGHSTHGDMNTMTGAIHTRAFIDQLVILCGVQIVNVMSVSRVNIVSIIR